jgi:hypothetical protein
MKTCLSCSAPIAEPTSTCDACGVPLAGTRRVALEPLQEEAVICHGLLKSADLHPVMAYVEETGEPHPVDPEVDFGRSAGLMTPVTTPFGIYVPDEEVAEAQRVLADARKSFDEGETTE